MMTKNEYLALLDKELRKMPEAERRNAIQYYIEYFDEAGEGNEQAVISDLGAPKDVASVILSNYAIKTINNNEKGSFKDKINMNKLKWGLIGLVTLPISLPLAAFITSSVFALICGILAVIVTVFCVGFGMSIGSIVVGIAAIILAFTDVATGLLILGVSLICLGIGILLLLLAITVASISIKGVKTLITKIIKKRRAKNVEA